MSELPPPPRTGAPANAPVVLLDPPPRPGELTLGWRIGTAFAWVAVILAWAGVWNVSVQLGLSTWWLGPRGEPQPRLVQLSPFVVPVLMLLGTINNVRRLGWFGLAGSAVLAAIAIGDLNRVVSIALTELVIAAAAAVISLASLTGTYRAPADGTPDALDGRAADAMPAGGTAGVTEA